MLLGNSEVLYAFLSGQMCNNHYSNHSSERRDARKSWIHYIASASTLASGTQATLCPCVHRVCQCAHRVFTPGDNTEVRPARSFKCIRTLAWLEPALGVHDPLLFLGALPERKEATFALCPKGQWKPWGTCHCGWGQGSALEN